MDRLVWACRTICLSMCLLLASTGFATGRASAAQRTAATGLTDRLAPLVGPHDAVAVIAPDGWRVVSINADRLLVPASILKTLTALAALHYLGEDYHYPTDFFIDPRNNLVIKGYGDPLLVSERIAEIARHLAEQLAQIESVVLDDTYFSHPITIPGRTSTTQPYDAPNGALCVNFNTVNFRSEHGHWVSAEPQTPLLPFAIKKIKASGQKEGRITLADDRMEILQYSGELFAHFLGNAGITISKGVAIGTSENGKDKLLWRYTAPNTLQDVVAALLEFSNNFIANQLMLSMGAKVYGPPGTMDKGLGALQTYYTSVLGIKTGHIAEASGLSRDNRISADAMLRILDHFQSYYQLMRQEGRQWYKTGTLRGIHTRAGYLNCSNGECYRFVVMINTPGKKTDRIMRMIEQALR